MNCQVIIPEEVANAINAQIVYLMESGAPSARVLSWWSRLVDRIDLLAQMPRRYPRAEIVSEAKGYEIHRINHGDYAVFFRIDDDRGVVEIIAFRHGRQRPWLETDE